MGRQAGATPVRVPSVMHFLVDLILLLGLSAFPTATASDGSIVIPTEITLSAGYIPSDSFGSFQFDLLGRLERFAQDDNVTLTFDVTEIQELYGSNLPLISPECHDTVIINEVNYSCNQFDMLVGDFWTNPE